jgi:hypothetical protein
MRSFSLPFAGLAGDGCETGERRSLLVGKRAELGHVDAQCDRCDRRNTRDACQDRHSGSEVGICIDRLENDTLDFRELRPNEPKARRDLAANNRLLVSASPTPYAARLDVFLKFQGMRSSTWLLGWPSMMAPGFRRCRRRGSRRSACMWRRWRREVPNSRRRSHARQIVRSFS